MDNSLGGMFKLTGSNYPVWKSKMRDMLVVKDIWLPIQFGDKIDATTWEVMHMKTTAYIRCRSVFRTLRENREIIYPILDTYK